MPPRSAGAPRLIEWTGERAVPWAPDVQVIYEHYHRYFWARALVAGLRVLDVGSGEGFGSALLADVAESVVGIDLDARTVDHSRLSYSAENLEYRVGSATDLAAFPDGSIDVVVAFEIVEHIEDQETMLREIARVLTDTGFVIMSTPDRRAYSEATGQENPYHVRELSEGEFRTLLGEHFPELSVFGQRSSTGSRIETIDRLDGGPRASFHLERAGDEWREAGRMSAKYMIAVAGRGDLPPLPADSTLSDYGLTLMREAERIVGEYYAKDRERLSRAAEHGQAQVEALQAVAMQAEGLTTKLVAAEDQNVANARTQTRLMEELDEFASSIHQLRRELQRVEESVTWRAFQRVRGRLYRALGGSASRRSRVFSALLRRVGEAARRARSADSPESAAPRVPGARLVLPTFADPKVSIVIATHDGAEITERCLRAILAFTDHVPYEVIVVDDAADARTKVMLADVAGITLLTNPTNIGYLRSVNLGSAEAAGRFIVQLNNDTEPRPGWLAALVDRAESDPEIGVVAAKLIALDGSLQEAGGIIWQDGSGWNYGRGASPEDAAFNFVRDVDYGSAAALLIRTEVWQEVGGFDTRFVPGYYEDTDLCFAAREAGWRVVYEPRAEVVHLEGATMGTDIATGGKRYQEVNRAKFVKKWAARMAEQHPGPVPGFIHMAANRCRGSLVLVVDHRVPSPDRDSGSLRMWHIVRNLLELGHRVVFLPDNLSGTEPYTTALQSLGVEVLYGHVDLPARLAGMVGATDLVILSRPYVAARYLHVVREFLPHTRVAYDTVDLHYVRELGRGALEDNADTTKADGLRELEHALSRGSDVALTVSRDEADRLVADAPGVVVEVVPNANSVWDIVPDVEGRDGLLFVGGFEHAPNVDAALHLAAHVMPLVWRTRPEVRLTIVGSQAPPEVCALSAPNIRVAGWVEDLDPLLASSVALVAPLRFGAGVKGKVTQSLGAGLPVVTSTLGAEGIHAQHGTDLLVAHDAADFAAQVIRLLGDPDLWRELSRNGQDLVRRVSSPEAQREALARLMRG